MIRVNDEFVITVNDCTYIAAVDKHKTDKEGKPMYKTIGYYPSVKMALKGIFKYKARIVLGEGEKTLTEAINALETIENEFEEALQVVKDI